jgi:homospermidine synthase
MPTAYEKYIKFDKKLLIVGFGSIGQAILPLIFRHISIKPEQVLILTKKDEGAALAKEYGVSMVIDALHRENYKAILQKYLQPGDFLLNLSVDVSSSALVEYCQQQDVLYLDTCIEPWEGGYVDPHVSASLRSNYAMREAMLAQRKDIIKKSTAVVAHGANPGLVSHFVKQAMLTLAKDTGLNVSTPTTQEQWARLAQQLSIKVIHIAERDTQVSSRPKRQGEFVNTWSIDGFVGESAQPAELGWGTHEKHWPFDGCHHDFGSQCAIYLNRPGATTRVRTWTPLSGSFHGYLITHTEAISITNYFTVKEGEHVHYRPTVHFAYHPCEDAVASVNEYIGKEWQQQTEQRILFDEIIDGMDELGVLLMGHAKGAYWFGSQLTIHEARKLAPNNNATSLQVATGALSGMIWAMAHPERGLVEPDEIDFDFVMTIAKPYLGHVGGYYTDWTPLKQRQSLYVEKRDPSDPWQFINIRVD